MNRFKLPRFAFALIPLVVAAANSHLHAQERLWPDSWSIVPRAGEVVFAVEPVGDSDHAHLHVRNERNIGQLFVNTAIPLDEKTTLKWRWNVRNIPSDVAEDTPDTHHYYAVAVRFDNDQILSYIWSATLPEGAAFACPLPAWKDRETHIVLHSGSRDFGNWLGEERNLLADYQRYKQSAPPRSIAQVWVIAAAVTGDGAMTLADLSISDARGVNGFLSGRGFSAQDQRIAAIHATLPGVWTGQLLTLDAGTGETSTEDISVGYVMAGTDGLDYAYQGPAGISMAKYLGEGSFEIRQFPYSGNPSSVAFRIEELNPPDDKGNWSVTELVTMTQQNRTTVQWRQVWSLQDGLLQLTRGKDPVSGEAQSAQRFLGYSLRKEAPAGGR